MPQFFPLLTNLFAQEQTASGGYQQVIDRLARTPLSQIVILVVCLSVLRLAVYPKLKSTPPHLRFGLYRILRYLNELLDAIIYAAVFVFMIIRPFAVQAFVIPSGSMWPTLYVNDFIVVNKAIYRYTNPKVGDIVVFRPPVEATYGHPDEVDADGAPTVDLIKRCQGVPGDVVEVRDGVLYRNGQPASDPTRHYSTTQDYVNFAEMPQADAAELHEAHASFKFVMWKDHLIPLNYTKTEANASVQALDQSYMVHPNFVIPDPADQQAAIKLPAQPLPPGFYFMMGDNRNNSFDGRGWGMVPRQNIIGRAEFIWFPPPRIGRVK